MSTVPIVGLSIIIALGLFHDKLYLVDMLTTYAAVVFSFFGGIHWGLAVLQVEEHGEEAKRMFTESLIMMLLAWGTFFIPEHYLRVLIFALLFALSWCADSLLYNQRIVPLWYFNLRGMVTPIVVVSMYTTYFSII